MWQVLIELLEETKIIFEKQAQIIYSVSQHRQSFHAHAEGKPDKLFAIDSYVLENVRMYHATTQDFQPACMTAYATTATLAYYASYIHFR